MQWEESFPEKTIVQNSNQQEAISEISLVIVISISRNALLKSYARFIIERSDMTLNVSISSLEWCFSFLYDMGEHKV